MRGFKLNRICCLVLALVSSCIMSAQERMTFLDWDILVQDTLCPVYREVVPLESDYRHNDYQVSLEYPTWASLTIKERELANKFVDEICDSICLDVYVSVDRGQGCLNYSFLPFVRQNGKLKKLVSAKVVIKAVTKSASARVATRVGQGDRYANSSVLATGTWKKIHITKDGMYRLTTKFLADMGFKNPNNVHLYGYGAHQQHEVIDADNDFDDLEEVPLFKATDGSLLFWGNGLLRWEGTNRVFNAYANKATYFLTEGAVRKDMSTEEQYSGTVRQTVTTTLGHALHEVDDYAWFRGGRNLVESTLFSGAYSKTYTLSNINSVGGNEKLTVVFTGTDVSTPLTIWANGVTVATKTISAPGSYMYYTEAKYTNMDVSECNAGSTWSIRLATQGPFATSSSVQGRLDYIALNYTQPLELHEGFVTFGAGYEGTGIGNGSSSTVTKQFTGPTQFAKVGVGNPNLKVMKLGTRGNPASLMPIIISSEGASFAAADGTATFVAFDPSYPFPEPTKGESVENQNLHAMDGVDMVIIIPKSGKLIAQANRLAEAHAQYGNIKCAVVRADQVYNEFSSGTPDATAYRRFMKMLYDRGMQNGSTVPRYLLLMGDCAWDNRMKSTTWRTYSPDDYLLCYQSENSYSDTHSYCWEDYFGLMDDGEGGKPTKDVSDLGIGRFPVTTEAQAMVMVNKTITHLKRETAGEWCNRVVVLGDDGDENIHMQDANRVAETIESTAPDVDLRKVMWDNYTRVNQGLYFTYPEIKPWLDKQMKSGAMLMNYTGHGATYLMSHERVITIDDMRAWKSTNLPLWFVAACDITPFDSQEENLGEVAVLNDGGAAVAFIGTTRTVYSTQNYYLNRYFSEFLFESSSDGTRNSVGDALRMAKKSMVSNMYDGAQSQNKLQYALLGDPALVFGNTKAKVVLDSINGVPVSEEVFLKAGSRVRLSGHIESAKGVVNEAFEGDVYYRLYDSKAVVTTRANVSDEPFVYSDWNKEIVNGMNVVSGGRFSTMLMIPKDINFSDENGRLVFYAVNKDKTIEANGSCEDFCVGGYSDELMSDTLGPDIFMYFNDKDFVEGDVVSDKPVFVAELSDESGIQYNGNGLGHDLQLCIDGDVRKTFNLNEYYSSDNGDFSKGKIYFTDMPVLEQGAHWLSFRAWDMLNNTSQKTLRFIVGKDLQPEVLSLLLDEDVVSGKMNFHVSYNYPGMECSFVLEIFSLNGAIQWRQEIVTQGDNGIVTIPWDGTNGDGAVVNNGIYICKLTTSYDGGKKSHKEKKFIVRRNK